MLLTKNELVFIDDKITVIDPSTEVDFSDSFDETLRPISPGSAEIAVSMDFAYEIGLGLLDCIENEKTEIELDFSIYELLLIREIAQSSQQMGGEKVGMSLKIKVYKELREKMAEVEKNEELIDESEELIDFDLETYLENTKDISELSKRKIQKLMTEWGESENASC